MDAVVRITKETLGVNEIVIGACMACCLVMLVDGLLAKHRQHHAYASAKHNSERCIEHVVLSHQFGEMKLDRAVR
jgi:hypothetical protein